jgi:hypothetical protein
MPQAPSAEAIRREAARQQAIGRLEQARVLGVALETLKHAPCDIATPRGSLDFASLRMREALTFIKGMNPPPQPSAERPAGAAHLPHDWSKDSKRSFSTALRPMKLGEVLK